MSNKSDFFQFSNGRQFILLSVLIWLIQGFYSALNTGLIQFYADIEVNWLAIFIYSFSSAFSWFCFTPLIELIIRKIDGCKLGVSSALFIHVVSGITVAASQRLLNIALSFNLIKWTRAVDLDLLNISNFFGLNFVRHALNGIVVYAIIAACIKGYIYYKKHRLSEAQKLSLENQMVQLKIENLKYQLQPHFIFNSLQSISTLMHRQLNKADHAMSSLSDLLRFLIESIDKEFVTLADELFHLQKYVDLQKLRFEDRFEMSIRYEEPLLEWEVPAFLLQPIVENSVKHSLEKAGQTTSISLDISTGIDHVQFTIQDNGPFRHQENTNGLGLKNIEQRIKAIYGDFASIKAEYVKEGGFRTIICLPIDK